MHRLTIPALFLKGPGAPERPDLLTLTGRDASFLFHEGGVTVRFHDGREDALLEIIGTDRPVTPVGEERAATRVTWFGEGMKRGGGQDAYTRVVYRDLKPGIDLVFSGNQERLSARFVVRPGVSSPLPRLSWKGGPPGGKPVGIGTKPIATGRTSAGSGSGPAAVAGETLEISYCGYLPGSQAYDCGGGIAVDGNGCAYVTGNGYAQPTYYSPPVLQSFLAKVSADGRSLEYVVFFGPGITVNDVAVDSSNRATIVGMATETAGLPVQGGPDLTHNGGSWDAFITRLDPLGTDIIYCGFIGGEGAELAQAVALDGDGNALVGGWTTSGEETFPVKNGPVLEYAGTHGDAWIAKVDSTGSSLTFCGYMGIESTSLLTGGESSEIAVDGNGDAYVCGSGWSDGRWAWWAKVRGASGARIHFEAEEDFAGAGNGICVDSENHVYTFDGFHVRKYSPGDSPALEYSYSYLDFPFRFTRVAVDGQGRALLIGLRYESARTAYDACIVRLKPDGSGFDDSRIFTGDKSTWFRDIAVDAQGFAYLVGDTDQDEDTFPVRAGPGLLFDRTAGNVWDSFVAKLGPEPSLILSTPNGGENWLPGTAHAVTWQARNVTEPLRLVLFTGGTKVGQVAGGLSAGGGTYSWTAGLLANGTTVAPGSAYRLRLVTNSGTLSDFSDAPFTLAGLRLTSPNGGESWAIGSARTVTWKAAGITGNVRLVLYRGGTKLGTIASGIAASAGSYGWSAGAYSGGTAVPGSDYRIKIISSDNTASDTSDSAFTLTGD